MGRADILTDPEWVEEYKRLDAAEREAHRKRLREQRIHEAAALAMAFDPTKRRHVEYAVEARELIDTVDAMLADEKG